MNDMIKIEKDMTPKLIGDTYMKYPTEISPQRYSFGLYECQYCGKEFEAQSNNIKHGLKSCGCQRKGINKTHGLTQHRFYQTWRNMIVRCTNPKDRGYKNYGGRGITVCEEWLDARNFIAWCEMTYPNIEGLSLDRIDNDKGYSPDNCRWADRLTQALNQRKMKHNKSGYVGVYKYKKYNRWGVSIGINNSSKHLGTFKTKEEAVEARDIYIIENSLPHKLSTEYKKEN